MRGKKGGIACGDRVEYQLTAAEQGVIETVCPRTSLLYRSDAFKEKIIAANVTQVIIVVAAIPSFSEELINRCLVDKVKASTLKEAEVEAQMVDFLKLHVPSGISPMCGNSICQDRRFMVRSMPQLEAYFHYRNLDVSTLKELAKRWKPEIAANFSKDSKHEALADIYDSINELKHYRQHFIVA